MVVVKHDNALKEYFDMIMLPVSCYNVFGSAYYSAFGSSNSLEVKIIDWVVESLFLIDILFSVVRFHLVIGLPFFLHLDVVLHLCFLNKNDYN